MNSIIYEPINLLRRISNDVNLMLSDVERAEPAEQSRIMTHHWSPAVDIKEEPDRYVLIADVPGIPAENIDITMENGVLTVSGERAWTDDVERKNYKRVERSRGRFCRQFSFTDSGDPESVSATERHGVLEISVPKRAQAQPHRVPVS